MTKETFDTNYKPKEIRQENNSAGGWSDSDMKSFKKRNERKKRMKLNKKNRKLQRARSKKYVKI